jgi:non-ribosomal peptide synthetase component F
VVIGVCIPPSDKLVLTLFAIEKLGGAYLPFEVSFPEDRVIKIAKDCRPVLIISDSHSNVLEKFDAVKDVTKVVSTAELFKKAEEIEVTEELMKKSSLYQSSSSGSDRTAIVLYTSGN